MNAIKSMLLVLVLSLGAGMAGTVLAAGGQGGPGLGSGPRDGTGPGRQARVDGETTSGWALMSRAERNEHRDRLRSMKTYDECIAYKAEHHEKMVARAQEKGRPLPTPKRDACAHLNP